MPRRRHTEMPCRRGKKQKLEKTGGDSIPPSVYVVIGHEVTLPAYSVVKVNPFSDGGCGDDDAPIPIPRHLARLEAKHCMSFVPVRTRHGPWIVGVGGNSPRDYGPETIIFDTKTQEVIVGPKLLSTKLHPVLLPIGSRIYALARSPSVKGEIDFVPWFEVLDLSRAQVVNGHLVECKWEQLPRPPFFPWELSPRQYIFPPLIIVKSYVAVDSYILVSITEQMGTHMFNVKTEEWTKLDEHDLPFIGGAIPHGPLFLGFSGGTRAITAYKITVCATAAPGSSITEGFPSMSIIEFPIVTDMESKEEVVGSGRLVSLGNHGFCSFTCSDNDNDHVLGYFQHTQELVTMRAYTTEDQLSHDCLKSSCCIVISNQLEQVYSVCDSRRRLAWRCIQDATSL